jgi:polyferredoxin
MNRANIRYLRYAVQAAFLAITLLAGHQFYLFVLHFEGPGHPFVQRPPSVDAFLPIAGMMSFKYFLYTRIVEPVHPAAFVMFTAIVGVSLFLKKGFCGWICPIGSVSQYLWMAGEKLFGRNFRMRRYADISLRAAKYILMSFFILIIWVKMPAPVLGEFFLSDYYKIADVKTMKFFTGMSAATLGFLAAMVGLSLLYKNFWCRYLCPYGALLGLLSRLSPVKVRRSENNCSHCHACSRHCPAHLDVEKQDSVTSAECFGCMTCVSRCPSKGALDVSLGVGKKRRPFPPYLYAAALVLLFTLIIGAGITAGKWHSGITYPEYKRIIPGAAHLDLPY